LLDESEGSAHHQIATAVQRINQLLRHDPALQSVYEALESARIGVSEAVSDLNAYLSRVELDPARLATVEERMRTIFDLARKFKTEPEQLYALHQTLQASSSLCRRLPTLRRCVQQALRSKRLRPTCANAFRS
jgi:DNA repair protein RecN (Recombination protein N)